MALPVSDTFLQNSGTVQSLATYSGNWVMPTGWTWNIPNGSGFVTSATSGADILAYWNADTFDQHQYAEVVFQTGFAATGRYCGPAVRCGGTTSSNASGYGLEINGAGSYGLGRIVNGAWTSLTSGSTSAVADGSVMRVESENVTSPAAAVRITVKRAPANDPTNFSTVFTYDDTDAARLTSGKAGICGYDSSADPMIASFAAGNVSGGNAAPTFTGPNIDDITVTVNTSIGSNDYSGRFSDSDALTFSIVGTLPAGVTLSSAGVLSGTPTETGTFASLAVRATDTASQTVDSDTFTITVNAAGGNSAPTFSGPNIGNMTLAEDVAMSPVDVSARFSDSDALTFSAVGSWPAGVTVSSAGVISGTPTTSGTYASLAVRATDTAAQTVDSNAFTITVAPLATLATPPLKNNTGTLLANESGATVYVYAIGGGHVVTKTGQTTDASGVMTITDAAISAGTQYRVVIVLASGAEGMDKLTAT